MERTSLSARLRRALLGALAAAALALMLPASPASASVYNTFFKVPLTVNGTYTPLPGFSFCGDPEVSSGYDWILWYAPGTAPDAMLDHHELQPAAEVLDPGERQRHLRTVHG